MKRIEWSGAWLGAFTAVLTVVFVGCGSGSAGPTTHVSGTVTLNGGPIPPDAQATISFIPINENTGVATSALIKDGKYDVPDAPVGTVRVEFGITQETAESRPLDDGRSGAQVVVKNLVPDSMRNGIEKTVSASTPEMDFDIK